MTIFSSKEHIIDPYPLYNQLREKHPVYKLEPHTWLVSKYEDVKEGLKNTEFFTAKRKMENSYSPILCEEFRSDLFIVTQDPPEHTKNRELLSSPFHKKTIDQFKPKIIEQAEISTNNIMNTTQFEFFEEFAYPFVGHTINKLLGLTGLQKYSETQQWIRALEATTTALNEDDLPEIERLILKQQSLFKQLIEDKRKHPTNDFTSKLINNNGSNASLTTQQLISSLELLYRGGFQTSVHLLAIITKHLIKNTEILHLLIQSPELIANFISEMLRLFSPVPATLRHTVKDITIQGITIPSGDTIWFSLAGANRDPDAFLNPNVIDLSRKTPNPSLAFGYGPHVCLGLYLAKTETAIAIQHLLPLIHSMQCPADDKLDWFGSLIFRGFNRLPINIQRS